MKAANLVVALTVVAAGGAAGWWLFSPTTDDRLAACRRDGGATVGADIGGEFTLTDHRGERVTADALIDRPTLIYFGYTFCPDFCPIDAANMAYAKDMLDQRGIDVNLAFVSIDPARDTPEVLAGFVDNLHPEMVGLTGTPEEVAEAARGWRVYYAIAGDREDPYYLVDHSTFTYLMAPEVGFLDFFRHGTAPDVIAERVACYADVLA
jgi:protein SCO1/2